MPCVEEYRRVARSIFAGAATLLLATGLAGLVKPVGYAQAEDVVEYAAIVEPMRAADISPRFDGLLSEILFEPGDVVKKGDKLIQFMTLEQNFLLKLEKAALERAKAQLKLAEANLERSQSLRKRDVTSQAELEAKMAERDVASANVDIARTQVEMREEIIRQFSLYAPFDGMVSAPFINEGAYITKEARSESRVATVTQLDPIRVKGFAPFDVYQARREILGTDEATKKGLALTIVLPNGEEYPHTGRIIAGGYEFDREHQRILFSAVFPNPDLLLRPGLKVMVKSTLKQQP